MGGGGAPPPSANFHHRPSPVCPAAVRASHACSPVGCSMAAGHGFAPMPTYGYGAGVPAGYVAAGYGRPYGDGMVRACALWSHFPPDSSLFRVVNPCTLLCSSGWLPFVLVCCLCLGTSLAPCPQLLSFSCAAPRACTAPHTPSSPPSHLTSPSPPRPPPTSRPVGGTCMARLSTARLLPHVTSTRASRDPFSPPPPPPAPSVGAPCGQCVGGVAEATPPTLPPHSRWWCGQAGRACHQQTSVCGMVGHGGEPRKPGRSLPLGR
jgi:hypothetical protein